MLSCSSLRLCSPHKIILLVFLLILFFGTVYFGWGLAIPWRFGITCLQNLLSLCLWGGRCRFLNIGLVSIVVISVCKLSTSWISCDHLHIFKENHLCFSNSVNSLSFDLRNIYRFLSRHLHLNPITSFFVLPLFFFLLMICLAKN